MEGRGCDLAVGCLTDSNRGGSHQSTKSWYAHIDTLHYYGYRVFMVCSKKTTRCDEHGWVTQSGCVGGLCGLA